MNIKSLNIILFVSIIMLFSFSANAFGANNISVYIDDKPVVFTANSGIPFEDANYRTLVPLRATMEAVGCNVGWNQTNNTATLAKDGTTVTVTLGQKYITKNGEKIAIDTNAIEKGNRIYLPIRAVLEAFGANIEYSNNTIWAGFAKAQNKTTDVYLISSYFEVYINNETSALLDISNGMDDYTNREEYFQEAQSFWNANVTISQNIINNCGNDSAGKEIKKVFMILNQYDKQLLTVTNFDEVLMVVSNCMYEMIDLENKVLDILKNM